MNGNHQMPHDVEAEQSVLGAILVNPEIFITIQERLDPEDFYRNEHQQIFRALALLSEERTQIDLVTLTNQLRTMDQLNAVGGPRYLGELSEFVPTSLNWSFYTDIVSK